MIQLIFFQNLPFSLGKYVYIDNNIDLCERSYMDHSKRRMTFIDKMTTHVFSTINRTTFIENHFQKQHYESNKRVLQVRVFTLTV